MWRRPSLQLAKVGSSARTRSLRSGSGSGECVPPPPGCGRRWTRIFGRAGSATLDHGQSAIAPGGVGELAIDQRMMQRVSLAGGPARRLAATTPHAGEPAAPHELRFARLRHVDDREDVIGEIGEVDRGVGIAPAHVPDPVRPHSVDGHETNLARLLRLEIS
jgi:hypothetical protein